MKIINRCWSGRRISERLLVSNSLCILNTDLLLVFQNSSVLTRINSYTGGLKHPSSLNTDTYIYIYVCERISPISLPNDKHQKCLHLRGLSFCRLSLESAKYDSSFHLLFIFLCWDVGCLMSGLSTTKLKPSHWYIIWDSRLLHFTTFNI